MLHSFLGCRCIFFTQHHHQVYVATSGIAGGGEGLFARKQFLPGDLVSYFSGKKKLEDELFFDNMTAEEEEDAESYSFGLAEKQSSLVGRARGSGGRD